MDFQIISSDCQIRFTLPKPDPELIEKLSFIHLVEMKFSGEITECGWFHYTGNDPYVQITLSFPNFTAVSDARVHCNQFLDDGSVALSYKGALKCADPGFRTAKEIKSQALANRLDE